MNRSVEPLSKFKIKEQVTYKITQNSIILQSNQLSIYLPSRKMDTDFIKTRKCFILPPL